MNDYGIIVLGAEFSIPADEDRPCKLSNRPPARGCDFYCSFYLPFAIALRMICDLSELSDGPELPVRDSVELGWSSEIVPSSEVARSDNPDLGLTLPSF
jgi:hypothetical protein